MLKTIDFYKTLFDKDEYTCFTSATNGRPTSSHAIRAGVNEKEEFFTINPIHKNTTRNMHNVSAYRNILIEIDEDENENKIPREKQKEMFIRLAVPYATLVWSGGKSFHGIISIEEGFEDLAEYKQAVLAVYRVLGKNGFYHDKSVKDAARLSRAPGVLRISTREEQTIENINRRITRKEFDEWLALYDEKVEAPQYHSENMAFVGTSDANDDLKWEWIKKYYMKNDEYRKGQRHNYQIKMAYLLLRTGMDARVIDSYFIKHFGEVSSGIGSCTKLDTSGLGETIYVPTMEERRAYMRAQEQEEQINLVSEETINLLTNRDEVVAGEALNHYVLVDNDFYWVDPQTNERRKRTDKAIRARFPGVRIHEIVTSDRQYKGFKYYPNYMNYQRDLGGYYNTFEWFGFQPTPGNWDDIRIHLKHLFGEASNKKLDYQNQYNQIIEWFRVAVTDPTHPLWAIVLTSKEHGVGKNILAIILKRIFGPNFSAIRRVDIENERFNNAFAETQICFIDEFEKVKDPIRAYGTFKEMITATEGIRVEKKGIDSYEVPFYGKFVFAHNASQVGFPGIEANDRRFWIREVSKPTFTMNDAYVQRIKEQIPHFVYFLMYEAEPLYNDSKNALWLPAEDTWTIWLDNAKESNRSYFYHKIKAEVDHYFQDTDEDVLYTTARSLGIRLQTDEYRKITFCLKEEFGCYQDEKVTRRRDFITGSTPKNGTTWFHITREMVQGPKSSEGGEPIDAGDMGENYFNFE